MSKSNLNVLSIDSLMADLEKSAGITKAASVASAPAKVSTELANILEKKASEDITKAAFQAGEALAQQLLTKFAADNAIQAGDAAIVARDTSKVLPTQTAGSFDAPFIGTIETAIAKGATSDDVVDQIQDQQTKQAQIKSENTEMAKGIMKKIAQMVGEDTTTPAAGEALGSAQVPNLLQQGTAAMTAQDDAKVLPMPGTEGSLNSILEAVVARAEEQGAVSDNLVDGNTAAPSSVEGGPEDEQEKAAAVDALVGEGMSFSQAVALVKQAEEDMAVEADQQEKFAAVQELCAAGYDFDSAVALVKQAEADLAGEVDEQEKVAAVDELMGQGYNFEDAVALVKQAVEEKDHMLRGYMSPAWQENAIAKDHGKEGLKGFKANAGKHITGALRVAGRGVGEGVAGAGIGAGIGAGVGAAIAKLRRLDPIAGAKIGAALGGSGGLYGGEIHGVVKSLKNQAAEAHEKYRGQEKKAAFDALVEAGIDFDQAMALVKQAEADVYGQ